MIFKNLDFDKKKEFLSQRMVERFLNFSGTVQSPLQHNHMTKLNANKLSVELYRCRRASIMKKSFTFKKLTNNVRKPEDISS